MTPERRVFLQHGAAAALALTWPAFSHAQVPSPDAPRRFDPQPGAWRTFEVTTRVDIQFPQGQTRVWLPVPSVDSDWQQSLESRYSSNGQARMRADAVYGARLLHVDFSAAVGQPYVEITSTVRTRNRATDWATTPATDSRAAAADLAFWTRPTALLPTDGIVRQTALAATRGAGSDLEKARAIYDWVVNNTYREPRVRGCGEGDIKTLLETGDLGGKCADLNALFVGLCRAVGLPARDIYGLRLAPSAFGYKELSGNAANLKGAQHCRAEVYLRGHGWVAADPADVAKVMRQETAQWIKTTRHPVVEPVYRRLFGSWEGNWLAWNAAHDVRLPGTSGPRLGFLMYPVAETEAGRLDSYAPDDFAYRITARELSA